MKRGRNLSDLGGMDFGNMDRHIDSGIRKVKGLIIFNVCVGLTILGLCIWGVVYTVGQIQERGVKGIVESVWNGNSSTNIIVE